MKHLILLLLIGYGIYYYMGQQDETAAPVAMVANANGFVEMPMHIGAAHGVVYVMAALNCPKEAAQRAEELAFQLKRRGVVVQRISGVSFDLPPSPSLQELQQRQRELNAVLAGQLPIVLFNGMGSANPDLESVLAEINRQRG